MHFFGRFPRCFRSGIACLFIPLLLLSACPKKQPPNATGKFSAKASAAAALPWRNWSPALFEESSRTGKPVFLSVTTQLCPWCRTLDETTLSHDRVGALLRDKFILARADAAEWPELEAHLGLAPPIIAVLSATGDVVWKSGFIQPTPLNKVLYQTLRGELPVILEARSQTVNPMPGRLDAQMANQLARAMGPAFDYDHRGYQTDVKRLAAGDLMYEYFAVAKEANDGEAHERIRLQLAGVWGALFDSRSGGFWNGTSNAAWNTGVPIKRPEDQATMAAFLLAYASEAANAPRAARPLAEYAQAASDAVAYVLSRLDGANGLAAGEWTPVGETSIVDNRFMTETAARTAESLLRAARIANRADWRAAAEKWLSQCFALQTHAKLFWRIPAEHKGPDKLADAAAVLAASVEMYQSSGEAKWLARAESVAEALEPFFRPQGYYLSVTSGVFTGEPEAGANVRAARALWRLGLILNSDRWLTRAIVVGSQYADQAFLGESAGDWKLLVWQVTGPALRFEIPLAWQNVPEAAALLRTPDPRFVVKWGAAPARVCTPAQCSGELAEPASMQAILQRAVSGGGLDLAARPKTLPAKK